MCSYATWNSKFHPPTSPVTLTWPKQTTCFAVALRSLSKLSSTATRNQYFADTPRIVIVIRLNSQ